MKKLTLAKSVMCTSDAGASVVRSPVGLDVEIDRDVCMGSGNCVYEAPGAFDLDEDTIVVRRRSRWRAGGADHRRGAEVPDSRDHRPARRRDRLNVIDGRARVARLAAWRAAMTPKTMVLAMLAPGPR